ncbi:hypothetical protein predicted by Glimmer/Critica [Secundilactobacillus pentosiphilus]|uniref:EF-hand domain-containing protein n=1 Tax=Secundilactobacillus pentosiphilus TaxID=1714682 RepID=A0A1Z5IZH9_9LACO|nr:DUF3037 domain-containing protein [Secundilactobacillus pentosiphilus]GAX07187.1 hypothetical protein predicted by Glimmer/Critica [Secundilactobacillus pentosiphilus]
MENFKMFYAVLRYIPSSIRMESINIGIVVHIPSLEYSHFYRLKNTRRVASFDDEYDKDFFKMTIDSLRFDLNYPTDTDQSPLSLGYENRFNNINHDSFLQEKISFLSNGFQFSPIQILQTNYQDWKNDVNGLKKTFLYYDRPKSQRITRREVEKILSKNLRSYNLSNVQRHPDIKGDFSDEAIFDFKVGNKYIKALSFDYARKSTMATELKSALYDLNQTISKKKVSHVIIATNDDYSSKADSPYEEFSNNLKYIEATYDNTNIKLVPLSEFRQALNE